MRIYVVASTAYDEGAVGAFDDYAEAERLYNLLNERDGWGDWNVYSLTLNEWPA